MALGVGASFTDWFSSMGRNGGGPVMALGGAYRSGPPSRRMAAMEEGR